MNKQKRAALMKATGYLDMASDAVRSVIDDEQESYDNMPENLQESERGEKMDKAIDSLMDAVTCIDSAKDHICDAIM